MKVYRYPPSTAPGAWLLGLTALLLGAALSVDGKAGDNPCLPTEENVEGPYYRPGAPFREVIMPEGMEGDRLEVSGTVFARDCVTPLEGAVIDVWQTDAGGEYDFSDDFALRGRVRTDSRGRYRFETVLPGRYRVGSTYRPAHIHLRVSHPRGKTLVTQLYFAKDPYNRADPFVRPSLVVPLKRASRSGKELLTASFDIVLEGP